MDPYTRTNRFCHITKRLLAPALWALWLSIPQAHAERLTLSASDIRASWIYPVGVIQLDASGPFRSVFIEKNINPFAKATVRGAGAALSSANRAFDGDPLTGWSPPEGTPIEDWQIEIDFGQVLPLQQIRLQFDENAPPLGFFTISLSKGEGFINSANVLVEGTLLYSGSERFAFNEAHELTIDLENEMVKVIRIEADRAPEGRPVLAEIAATAYGDNIAFGLIENGGSVEIEAAVVSTAGRNPAEMFDGELSTMYWVGTTNAGSSRGGATFGSYNIDLGAKYRIDSAWLHGAPLGIPPRRRHFYANFVSYQVFYSDGSLSPDGSLFYQELAAAPNDNKNLLTTRNFRHDFAPVTARHLRVFFPTSEDGFIIGGGDGMTAFHLHGLGLVGELQVYGEGHPVEVELRSPVIDLGSEWNITEVEWDAEQPPGSQFLLRSRTGDQIVEENRYFEKKGKEITQKRYEKLIKSFRGPIETTLQPGDGWSIWSEEYIQSGTQFRSPSPRRYVQLEAEMLSTDPQARIALDELALVYSRPLAHTALGEVHPALVEPGAETEFTYFLRPDYARNSQGFGAIALEASVPLTFREIRIDGTPIDVEITPTDAGLRLHLPQRILAAERVELHFAATVFQNSTRFRAFLERENGLKTYRQQVDPGNAVPEMPGAGDAVSLPVDQVLLTRLDIGAGLLTPNGDGINDALEISFDVLKVIDARPIEARICDLHGRLVRTLNNAPGVAGHYSLSWDGHQNSGALASPGLYLFHLQIAGDSITRTLVRSIGLSY